MSNQFDDLFRASGFKERDFRNIYSNVNVSEGVQKNSEYEDFCKLNIYLDRSIFTHDVYDKLVHDIVEYQQIDLFTRFSKELIWTKWLHRKLREINQKERSNI
ncbi:hypothetical protein V5E38_01480 [Rossellomorea sp. GAMAL-10_SWC]